MPKDKITNKELKLLGINNSADLKIVDKTVKEKEKIIIPFHPILLSEIKKFLALRWKLT